MVAKRAKRVYGIELVPEASGQWDIQWNDSEITLTVGAQTQRVSLSDWSRGFNHLSILFEGTNAALQIATFDMEAIHIGMATGIEY